MPLDAQNLGRSNQIMQLMQNPDQLASILARTGPPPNVPMPQPQAGVGAALTQPADPKSFLGQLMSKMGGSMGGMAQLPGRIGRGLGDVLGGLK